MGGLSIWHWLIFLVVALLLFGGSGKISSILGDVAKGIKSFKKGMSEDDVATTPAADPFKKEEPKALNAAGAPTQTAPAGQVGAASVNTAQVNKAS
jgi:sec-independent protein translocase protein TatA